jgi:GcrA cell cycle regulator
MLWTDEAVESLKRLATEGLSASVIAATLGAESRNAVIGKASRIGITLHGGRGGRAKASGRSGAAARRPPPSTAAQGRSPAPPLESEPRLAWTFAGAEVGDMRRVRLADMRESACRWPLGDPRSGDFAYCGLSPAKGRAYCAGHCRMAYRPPGARARESAQERTGSRSLGGSWRMA